ncbi:MAG: ATP-grasp domain-containing protein [Fusobacteria bacterium]|nr:ATP-grasp domain-containing protein [Fusobacteriota bacterium]
MRNVVYLSPHFPPNFKFFLVALKKKGARVLAIGDEAYEMLSPEVKECATEYYRVSDMHNINEMSQACEHFQNKYGPIFALDSHIEYWLNAEAQLREWYNIDGLKPIDMFRIKNKSGMKEVYRSLGLCVADGQVVNSLEDALNFMEKIQWSFPIVAKPDSGVGSASTYKIHNYSELVEVFHARLNVPYILEEFITGQIVTFDGLADNDSNVIFRASHLFSEGLMNVVNNNLDISWYSLRNIPPELEEIGRKCVKAFNVKRRFFHMEFFWTPDNQFIPLEVNMRPPGGVLELFNFAHDFDVCEVWADMIVNDNYYVEYDKKFYAGHISRKNCYNYELSHEEIMHRYRDCIVGFEHHPKAFARAMGDFYYVVRTKDVDKMNEITRVIQKKH